MGDRVHPLFTIADRLVPMMLPSETSAYEAMIYTANISMEFISLLLCSILAVAVLARRKNTKSDRAYAAICFAMLLNVIGDFLSWFFTRGSNGMSIVICQLGNTMTYVFAPLAYTGIMMFAYNGISCGDRMPRTGIRTPRTVPGKFFLGSVIGLLFANLLLVIINIPTGCLYSIHEGNRFVWGPLTSLPDLIVLVQYILTLDLMLAEASSVQRGLRHWLFCAGTCMVGLVCELLLPTLMTVVPTATISIVLMYMQLSYRNEMALMQKDLELSKSQTKLLSGQIRSHFIFNSLAAIEELCIEDPERARQGLEDFSRYLRGNMQAVGDGNLIPFSREVENVKSYLAFELIDPSTTFQVEWDLEETSFRLPSLVIQPLVENAVRHGVSRRGSDGLIRIRSWEDDEAYCVSVEDNGAEGSPRGSLNASAASVDEISTHGGRDIVGKKQHNGIAIDNTRTRLTLMCDGTLDLTMTDTGAIATVRIPKGAIS